MKRTIYHLFCACVLLALGACAKDETLSPDPSLDGEGEVAFTVDFRPLDTGLAATRTAGDAIKRIEDLCVLLYRTDNRLAQSFYLRAGDEGFEVTDVARDGREPEHAAGGYKPGAGYDPTQTAEAKTPRATFTRKVPYGNYYVYVTANMGDVANSAEYGEAVQTVEGLKRIRLEWDPDDVAANRQMFGYCEDEGVTSGSPNAIRVDASRRTLHAWLRRAASKLTVAFDASKLKEKVFIYIHSVQIKDIPATCLLGQKNTPASDGELIGEGEKYAYPTSSAIIDANADCKGLYLSNGPNTNHGGSDHAETEPVSLFFYENMQTAEGPLKGQDKSGDNTQVTYPHSWKGPGEPGYKDDVRYGTYVEVKGYYVSDNPERIGHGPITYRFMLGKDTERNYEAERNHHYQLTLRFNGFANDVDWHIQYEEPDPGVYVKTPQYISYLYDRKMSVYVKVAGEMQGDLKAEIVSNHWYPDDAKSGTTETLADRIVYYWDDSKKSSLDNDYDGFLGLRRTKLVELTGTGSTDRQTNKDDYALRRTRTYATTAGVHEPDANPRKDDRYDVRVEEGAGKAGGTVRTFEIPLFTRARSLTSARGFSGNNRYMGHERTARIKFTASLKVSDNPVSYREFSDYMEVHQVRRLVNPKGIWRAAGSKEPFHVRLKVLDDERETDFVDVVSNGPWKAEIAVGDWFTIEPEGQSEWGKDEQGRDIVVGRDHTAIAFKYEPKTTVADGTVRCGIIRIYYHNHTCVHLIFVRQGYAPLAVVSGGVRWHTGNVRSLTASGNSFTPDEVGDPRDEGSYFKWRQPAGILASNNKTFGFGVNPDSRTFRLSDGTDKSWTEIAANGNSDHWSLTDLPGTTRRVAKRTDYETLLSNTIDAHVQYGFGVLYADGATQTATTTTDAFGYYAGDGAARGMRGCFVYYWDDDKEDDANNGNQIFFPIGAEGYGRRKDGHDQTDASGTSGEYRATGVLRYANRFRIYNKNGEIENRPLLFDLYRQSGAVYWCREYERADDKKNSAWDINYSTFNFAKFENNAYAGTPSQSDACLLRLVSE